MQRNTFFKRPAKTLWYLLRRTDSDCVQWIYKSVISGKSSIRNNLDALMNMCANPLCPSPQSAAFVYFLFHFHRCLPRSGRAAGACAPFPKYLAGRDPSPCTKQPVLFIICYGPGDGVTLYHIKHRDMSHTAPSNNLFNKRFNEAILCVHRVTQYLWVDEARRPVESDSVVEIATDTTIENILKTKETRNLWMTFKAPD